MSVDYKRVYREDAGRYDQLVSAEDAEGNLLPALRQEQHRLKVDALERNGCPRLRTLGDTTTLADPGVGRAAEGRGRGPG